MIKKQNGCKDMIFWIVCFQKHTIARLLASIFFLFPQKGKRWMQLCVLEQ